MLGCLTGFPIKCLVLGTDNVISHSDKEECTFRDVVHAAVHAAFLSLFFYFKGTLLPFCSSFKHETSCKHTMAYNVLNTSTLFIHSEIYTIGMNLI